MFKMKTDMAEITALCDKIARIYEDCIVEEFIKWAERDDEYLRMNDGFRNQTGNLRSSLGAGVIKDAVVVFMTPFATVLNGSNGSAKGRDAIRRMASECQGIIAKVMVAGMDYAQKVEDIDSKDVLESRRIQCEREAASIMDSATRKAEQLISRL